MEPVTLSRVLFIIWMLNEVFVMVRSSPEERAAIDVPPWGAILLIFIFAPLFVALDYPPAFGWLLVAVQFGGLALELAGEFQLSQAKSFSIAADTPQQLQTKGLYKFLENPIYVGIFVQIAAWGLWMPIILPVVIFTFFLLRKMVASERAHLATQDYFHRGVDSFLWN